jgi:hypothetical protein
LHRAQLVFFGEVGDLDDGHFLTVASDNDFVCVVPLPRKRGRGWGEGDRARLSCSGVPSQSHAR